MRTRRAERVLCIVCERRVRLRRNGRIMGHRAKVWDGHAPPFGCVIGIVQCAGSGLDPRGDQIKTVPQRCGWCLKNRPKHSSNDCREHV